MTEQATREELLELAFHEAWIAESVLRAIAGVIEQRGEVVTHNAVEHRGLSGCRRAYPRSIDDVGWAASMFAAAERQVPCHLAALTISVAWSAIRDARVRQLDVQRLDVRIPDKTIAASRWACAQLAMMGLRHVLAAELDAPLAGDAWAEGWHPGVALDYVDTLHVASTAFTAHDMAATTALITDAVELGDHISVFATSSGGTKADSAHLVHRNLANADGAVVVNADSAPHYLLFRFANQTF